MKFKNKIILTALLSTSVLSSELIKLYPNTPARANDVNRNFSMLYDKIKNIENGNSSNNNNISAFANIDENIAINIPHIHTSQGIKYKIYKVNGQIVGYYYEENKPSGHSINLLTKKSYMIEIYRNTIPNTSDGDLNMGYTVYYSSSSCDANNDILYFNKYFMDKGEMRKILNNIYYVPKDAIAVDFDNITLYEINPSNGECESGSTSDTYYQAIPNDESITGFSNDLADKTFTTDIGTIQ